MYDRNHYFGLGLIPKPKPKLADTFLADTLTNTETTSSDKLEKAYRSRELWTIEPKKIVTTMTNPTTTFNEEVHSDVESDGYLRPNPIIEETVGGDK